MILNFSDEKLVKIMSYSRTKVVILPQDVTHKNGSKRYKAISLSEWDININEILSSDQNLYEVFHTASEISEKNLKLFFDLDMYPSSERQNEFHSNQEMVSTFLDFVSKHILLLYSVMLTYQDYLILDGTRPEKISFHIILQNGICFATMNICQLPKRSLRGARC